MVQSATPPANHCADCGDDPIWNIIRAEVEKEAEREPLLYPKLYSAVISHRSLASSLAFIISNKLATCTVGFSPAQLSTILYEALSTGRSENGDLLIEEIREDIRNCHAKDPACTSYAHCMLFFKGFQGLQSHRAGHWLWRCGRRTLALTLQSLVSEAFGMDIHPAAMIGKGVMIDHATGIVIGETAVIGDGCVMLHGVTLGGTGKVNGDRHPKLGESVTVGAGATILGNIHIGDFAKVAACSVVMKPVASNTTVAGCPAKVVGGAAKTDTKQVSSLIARPPIPLSTNSNQELLSKIKSKL